MRRQVRLWDISQQLGRMAASGWAPPGPNGLYRPLQPTTTAAVNGLCVRWLQDGSAPALVNLVTVHEDGCMHVYRAGQGDVPAWGS